MKIVSFDIGIKNLSYCIENVKDITKNHKTDNLVDYFNNNITIEDWGLINIANDDENANKINIYDINTRIVKNMDKIKDKFLDSDIILLEQQPIGGFNCNNIKMGRIAIMLQTYFIIHGIHNNNSTIADIKFVSPKNKLKLHPVLETVKEIKKNIKSHMTRIKK